METVQRTTKLYVHKKTESGLYYCVDSVDSRDFENEESLIRHVFKNCGVGSYYLNSKASRTKRYTKALWKGRIMKGEDYIEYRNVLDTGHLEEMGIAQTLSEKMVRIDRF